MFNELAQQINQGVRVKGFWSSMDSSLKMINTNPRLPIYERVNIAKATKDAFIAQKIALVMSEAGEALEAMRKPDYEANGYGIGEKDSFADELADATIRILDLCGELGIDIDAQIKWKMQHNASRPIKHGKEF